MIAGIELMLLLSAPVWPLLLAGGLVIPVLRPAVLRLMPIATLPALLCALLPVPDMELTLPWLLLETGIGLDDLSRIYLLFSAILWTAGGLMLPATGRSRFAAWFLITMAGNFALLLARDIPSFFLFYACTSLTTFGLVIHERTVAARHAARVYLVFAVLGEIILLTALLLAAHNAATLNLDLLMEGAPDNLMIILLLIGFGIKAGLPLLHLAIPPAYAALPLSAAVPVAGALLHLGLYGWMRFLPLGQTAVPAWSAVFIGIGTLGVLFGIALGLTQHKPKALLAYSSISQMGLITFGVGIGLGSPAQWPLLQSVLLLFALHHALAKGALFYGLGIGGRARIGLWLPALALAGLPLTGGALVKGLLKEQIHLPPEGWMTIGSWLLPLGSMGTTLLMGRFLYLVLRLQPLPREMTQPAGWWLLLAAMLLLPWVWPLPMERTSPLWSAIWPLLLAAVLAWLAYRGVYARFLPALPAVQPGDLLIPVERSLRRITWPRPAHPEHKKESAVVLQPRAVPQPLVVTEQLLGHWQVSTALLLLLVIGIFLVLALH